MTGALFAAILTFAAILLIALIVLAALSGSMGQAKEQLGRLWHGREPASEATFLEKQKAFAQRALERLGKMMPSSPKELGQANQLMIRAGIRSPEAVMILRGIKLLVPVALLAAVYFSDLYRHNPFFLFSLALVAGYLLPEFWLTGRVRVRKRRLLRSLPDALDLLVVCVEAGLGLDQSLNRVSQELRLVHPELSEELQLVNFEMQMGKAREDALHSLSARTGVDDLKSLTAMLIQTDRFGTDLAQALRVHSDNLRTKRWQRAEETAAKATVKMVPPLVFFIFPALFVVLLGPAIIILFRQVFPALNR
jgi:tight adherence protein C